MQYLRSLVFIVLMYLVMAVMAICLFPVALIGGRGVAIVICRSFCHWVRFSARWIVGLRTEVRGTVPEGDVLVCAKHQSFMDILMIYSVLPKGKFIMKRELVWTPFVGWYAWLIGCIPVNRGKGGAAVKAMLKAAKKGQEKGGQLVIFPQGTRVAPGAQKPYKVGAGALYSTLKTPAVPVAVNVGLFWPKHAILRKPGLAVVEFLPPIAPGLKVDAFMAEIETQIETRSNMLMAEAGMPIVAELTPKG
ncbi:lysophospholipid acyltransferase family protein [Thioclava sp. GXIMD4216]|uniref:Lysophospholipid acyltransferase family protein n=1 Tax=Thioclava litoralis TaxID=3076557 RepID=A0ABZ1E0Y8_9RHOB|nr:lysophospholipid acyltransferase family protein [Thioclava sp. FTW29]